MTWTTPFAVPLLWHCCSVFCTEPRNTQSPWRQPSEVRLTLRQQGALGALYWAQFATEAFTKASYSSGFLGGLGFFFFGGGGTPARCGFPERSSATFSTFSLWKMNGLVLHTSNLKEKFAILLYHIIVMWPIFCVLSAAGMDPTVIYLQTDNANWGCRIQHSVWHCTSLVYPSSDARWRWRKFWLSSRASDNNPQGSEFKFFLKEIFYFRRFSLWNRIFLLIKYFDFYWRGHPVKALF